MNKITGNKGEAIASNYLVENGYEILATNWRFRYSEVDIIASKDDCLHFIEVKTRSSTRYGNPEESITVKKMEKLKQAAAEYQYQYPQWKFIQFDVIAIVLEKEKAKEVKLFKDVYF